MENETQEELETGIGTREKMSLKPEKVKIVKVQINEVGEKKTKKVVFTVKHPAKEETIEISKIKYEKNKKLRIVGSWYSLDDDGLIQKDSATAFLLRYCSVSKLKELEGKEVNTDIDDDGFLCMKAY